MAWFADKARNLRSRGRPVDGDDSARVADPGGAKTDYSETGLSLPLDSGHIDFLDGALEQIQADAGIRDLLERVGMPHVSRDGTASDSDPDSSRKRGSDIPEEEHRLLTAFVLVGNGDDKFSGAYYTSAEAAYREAHKAVSATREKSLQGICLSALAAAVGMQGKHEQALKLAEDAVRRRPDLAEAWYNRGIALLLFQRYEEAVPCFDEALVHKPDLAVAWYNKGIALGNLDRYEEALPCFTETLGRDLKDADAWLGKGASQLMLGRYEEALASFEEALRRRKGFSDALLGKGLGLMKLGRHEEALPCFDKALRGRPEFAEGWVGRGQTLGEMGRHQDAASCFEKALLYQPELASAWENKGVALSKLGWWKQALSAHERARSLEKGRP